ncbi:MAG: Mrp/NBP35 family ATP-binding protein [Bacteroidales bacterium]|nr:Mrp/NBP35 family ATP-binding protein [Bacteroidales bacterium]
MALTVEKVLEALKKVQDPDLKKDLVTLNMIEDVRVEGFNVKFKLVLTTPACPMKELMRKDCEETLRREIDERITAEIELTSRVTTKRKQTEALLSKVKNIVAVASGKGGVGKSTIAANLAVALSRTGARTGLIDADIYGPSVPIMFDVQGAMPEAIEKDGKTKVLPVEKYGIKLLSIGFFVDPGQALVWRGPMASNALMQLFNDAEWGELDYLVVDLPPGTGDIHLTLAQQAPITGVAIVSTPQEVALADARKAINMFNQEKIRIPVLGLIENMSYFTPAELPENKYYLFGKEGAKKLAEKEGIALLGEIPIVQGICESGDLGKPIVLFDHSPVSQAFIKLAENVAQQVSIVNASGITPRQ